MSAAVFDLDGTLIDSEPRNQVMWAWLFERHGAAHDPALIASFAGRRGREVLAELIHLFPGRTVEELFAEAISYEHGPEAPPVGVVPGAVELVRALHEAGLPLGVATSGQRSYAEGLLDGLGVRDCFGAVVTADDVATGKPDPEGFLAACRGLGIPPERAVGFEDAPAGVAAIKAAGMTCVGVTTTVPAGALAAADHVVANLKEVDVLPGPALRVPGGG
ncbi:HAD family phosphatase [Spirillospora sp. NPDC029432]|uniref:HAD family hydrolase n=1 Tax=Spirillospora sp. NPDC029432 TaxID=3154599 RepID=UPI003454F0E0